MQFLLVNSAKTASKAPVKQTLTDIDKKVTDVISRSTERGRKFKACACALRDKTPEISKSPEKLLLNPDYYLLLFIFIEKQKNPLIVPVYGTEVLESTSTVTIKDLPPLTPTH